MASEKTAEETLIPLSKEMTTQEAADILNVSLPHVIDLLEKGALPFRKVGTHRRVLFSDLMDFKKAADERSRRAADELTGLSEELDLDY